MTKLTENVRSAAASRQTETALAAEHEGFALKSDVNTADPYVRSLVADVCDIAAWVENNPAFWHYLISSCRELVGRGRHFSFRMPMEDARYHATPRNGRELFKLPNGYSPVLCRMACAEVPGMRKLVQIKRSKYDEVLA